MKRKHRTITIIAVPNPNANTIQYSAVHACCAVCFEFAVIEADPVRAAPRTCRYMTVTQMEIHCTLTKVRNVPMYPAMSDPIVLRDVLVASSSGSTHHRQHMS